MCTRRLVSLALALVCLLSLTLGVAHGQATPPAPAAEPGRGAVNGPMAPSASYAPDMPPSPIRPLITYQGRLTEYGAPVTGVREMTFRLCAAQSETTCATIWSEGPKPVTVTNGLFTTMLGDTVSLPMNSFAYQPMLEVQVGSQVLPRQVLSGAPYAMTLAPRASIFGMVSEPDYLLNLYNFSGRALNAAGFGTAVYANSQSSRAIDATSSSGGWENATLYVRNTNSDASGAAANIAGQGLPPALILQNSYPGNDISGAALYAETNGGPVIRGVNTGGAGEVFSVQGNGDIHQAQSADGAIKAAVNAWCGGSHTTIKRSFGPAFTTITIGSDGSPGACGFNFGFNISDRFFTASAMSMLPLVVTCDLPPFHDPNMGCQVRDLTGAGVDSEIMVVIY